MLRALVFFMHKFYDTSLASDLNKLFRVLVDNSGRNYSKNKVINNSPGVNADSKIILIFYGEEWDIT